MENTQLDNLCRDATDPDRACVWISASAGSGKTRMLVHRVIRLLMADQKNILCLTFTNAAAYEIRERVFSIAEEWILMPEHELADVLSKTCYQPATKALLNRARRLFFSISDTLKVQTVHGFCKSLISSFPTETGVPPDFSVRELSEVYPAIFSQMLHSSDCLAEHLEQVSCELREHTLSDIVYKIMSRTYKEPKITGPIPYDICYHSLQCPEELLNALASGGIRDRKISSKLRALNGIFHKNHQIIEDYLKTFICLKSLERKNIPSIASKQVLQDFPNTGNLIHNIQDQLLEFAEQYYTSRISKRTFHLMHIVRQCIKLYNDEKKLRHYIDYDDIMRIVTELLSNPDNKDWVLFCLDGKIDHILVDESQDNSLEQWSIIAELCNEFFSGWGKNENKRTLFVVGDVKQSIYGFQDARPDYFHFMHRYFTGRSEDSITIQLSDSYRSTPPILFLVDQVFNTLREQVSFQSEEIRHTTCRINERGYVEIWPLLHSEPRTRTYAWDLENAHTPVMGTQNTSLLAKTIAKTIHSWIQTERVLLSKKRPIEAGDILILIRHRSVFVDQVMSELKLLNVPVVGRDRFSLMDHIVIQDLVNLGEFLLLPDNDMALAVLLKSPLFGYTDSMLYDIINSAPAEEKHSLWDKLQLLPSTGHVVKHLKLLISLSKNRSPLDLYSFVLSQHKKQLLTCLGQSSEEIIEEFINLIIEFQSQNLCMLEPFIHWIKNSNPIVKSNICAPKNAVRILTVHGAKGMQAPIVFLPDTTSVPKCELQVVFDDNDAPFWCANETNSHCKELKLKKKQEEYNEYLRLLYVAMTRAEDELYIAGTGAANDKSWYKIITTAGAQVLKTKRSCLPPMFPDEIEVLYTEN
ncbi:UvrD-helicase domain-containing protein [Candidatus Anaplasma sp. TIGMIC]|uniref:UvrD-helicase domain-containing protein n=1 Tax=Candidatus Anaplasma sp. TIGMIC TaxID=3020713 RepID=UPI00232D72BA|nr:UvrD-helicase domain-containing protein [Candidatus Anaplasma sp. TIGMIC]MDB1135200.1 UvrD-helicase domain-containing protein [Candidatus Anaplasma sp. TIGMIC]